ncbi:MAG: hypothetical protein EBV49_16180 [Betaproteobacteria bacterium]|nr:hypothetical protein [Betaproteobacteria bacterium]
MKSDEIDELFIKGRQDGAKLFKIADQVHFIFKIINSIAVIAWIIFIGAGVNYEGIPGGLFVFAIGGLLIFLLYAADTIIFNSLKVSVHNLFANLAQISVLREKNRESL